MMLSKIYRYLRFKNRFISGSLLIRQLGLPFSVLRNLNDVDGVGGFGPVNDKLKTRNLVRYSKRNFYDADFICFFKSKERYYCIKNRPLRKGCNPPRKDT